MIKIEIHDLAAQELDEAIEWYELQSKGLGKRFRKAVTDRLRKIRQNPDWYLKETENVFKAYTPKFPYKILYTVEEENIIIWAIAHMHRKPWYWQSRKK